MLDVVDGRDLACVRIGAYRVLSQCGRLRIM